MQKYTWKSGCPVSLENLVEIKVIYLGFDNRTHQGALIVNKKLANEVVSIFNELYQQQFPIERMELMDVFKGDDIAAMNANNTSAFNCRFMTGKNHVYSQHSYGCAIDINPLINPYVRGNEVFPRAGKKFVDRHLMLPGMITNNNIYKIFKKYGWDWGGDWRHLRDYQHFEKCS